MTQGPWLTAEEERAWRAYRRMNRLLYSRLESELGRDTRLSDPDYEVLSTLTESDGNAWRANELAERLRWSSSRLAHHVGRMERRGLVRREPCDDDGRGALICLTTNGRQTIEAAAPAHVASVRRHFIDVLTRDQLAAIEQAATAVVNHLTGDGAKRKS